MRERGIANELTLQNDIAQETDSGANQPTHTAYTVNPHGAYGSVRHGRIAVSQPCLERNSNRLPWIWRCTSHRMWRFSRHTFTKTRHTYTNTALYRTPGKSDRYSEDVGVGLFGCAGPQSSPTRILIDLARSIDQSTGFYHVSEAPDGAPCDAKRVFAPTNARRMGRLPARKQTTRRASGFQRTPIAHFESWRRGFVRYDTCLSFAPKNPPCPRRDVWRSRAHGNAQLGGPGARPSWRFGFLEDLDLQSTTTWWKFAWSG